MRPLQILTLAVVAFLPTVADAQLFPRLLGGKSQARVGSACPGGICPTGTNQTINQNTYNRSLFPGVGTGTRWVNRDGLSPRDHIEQEHGTNTAGMSHAEVLAARDRYHNTYGPGHPVKESHSHAKATVSQGVAAYRAIRAEAEYRGNYPAPSSVSVKAVGYGSSGVRVAGLGSTGGFAVGTVLPDGAVVTSVGVTVAKANSCGCGCANCTCNGEVQSAEASEMRAVGASVGERVKFRRALLAAGRKAKESGEISTLEFFVLSAASRNPVALQRMQEAVQEAAIEDGLASVNAVDWDSLIAFIEKLIPLIIKLIDLFS